MATNVLSDDDVRCLVGEGYMVLYVAPDRSVGEAKFDHWLATHDAEVVRAAMEAAWDEGERHESEYLMTWGQFCPQGHGCNPYRARQPTTDGLH